MGKSKRTAMQRYEKMLTDPRYNTRRVAILRRMDAVARLRARNMSVSEIHQILAEPDSGIKDPDGKPWSWRTIWQDCDVIVELWKKRHEETVDQIVPALLAEIREVRRAAWESRDFNAILASIRQERDLLGLDQPRKIEVGVNMRARIEQIARLYGYDVEQVEAELNSVLHELSAG